MAAFPVSALPRWRLSMRRSGFALGVVQNAVPARMNSGRSRWMIRTGFANARPDSELESVVRGRQAVHALRRFGGRPCRGRGAQVRACCRQNRMGRLWSLEQIGMGAGAGQFKNENVFVYLVRMCDGRHTSFRQILPEFVEVGV